VWAFRQILCRRCAGCASLTGATIRETIVRRYRAFGCSLCVEVISLVIEVGECVGHIGGGIALGIRLGVWLVGMAQAHTMEAVMTSAKALFLAISPLLGTFQVVNASSMILPRHITPRSLQSSAGRVRGGNCLLCSLALPDEMKLNQT
jgi:hypothetical protein